MVSIRSDLVVIQINTLTRLASQLIQEYGGRGSFQNEMTKLATALQPHRRSSEVDERCLSNSCIPTWIEVGKEKTKKQDLIFLKKKNLE